MSTYEPTVYLYLQGYQNNAIGGADYVGLEAKGDASTYLLFARSLLAPGTALFDSGRFAGYWVPLQARLYFSSGYPSPPNPPVALTVPTTALQGAGRFRPGQGADTPPSLDYVGSDGTVLSVASDAGRITGFSGASTNGYDYALSSAITTGTAPVPGSRTNTTVPWLWARMSITRTEQRSGQPAGGTDEPLVFGFGYCPWDNVFTVVLYRGSVGNMVAVDYNGAPQATLTRTITYRAHTFSTTEDVTIQSDQKLTLYPVGGATLWPFLDRVSYFSAALQKLETSIATQLSAYPYPLSALTLLRYTSTLSEFLSYNVPLIQPNLGALAAQVMGSAEEFADAALWLGWLLRASAGQQSLTELLTVTYQAFEALPPGQRGISKGGFHAPVVFGLNGKPLAGSPPFQWPSPTGNK
jgi:hypothetical protein